MTPRTMENSLNQVISDLLILQKSEGHDDFDLSENAPLLRPLHPQMVRALVHFIHNPEQEATCLKQEAKFYACYSCPLEARNDFPELKLTRGRPFEIHANLNNAAIFDFKPYGVAVISPGPLKSTGTTGIHQHLLPPFLEYALSAELWGPHGKWARFHARLHTQFDKYKLLKGMAFPGRYELDPRAKKLEQRGVKGSHINDSFVLTMPWTFSLTALIKLETILQEEF